MNFPEIFTCIEAEDAFIAGASFVVMIQIVGGLFDLLICFIKHRFIKSR